VASDEEPGSERSEQPTSRRREEARRQGRYPASRDLPGALVLLGGLGVHAVVGGHVVTAAVAQLERGVSTLPTADLTLDGAIARCFDAVFAGLGIGWPFLVVPAVIAAGTALLQSRFSLSFAAVKPQWSRVDPGQGLRRLLSGRAAVDLVRSLLKLFAVGAVAYITLRAHWAALVGMGRDGAGAAALGRVLWDLWLGIGLVFLLLAGFDYAYQWWQHEKSLRMTKQEVRQESKELEGNPQLRARVRALHRQMATRRMMVEVRRADVVLRNPTHYAVALRYDSRRMRAPRVVGKGERLLAGRIIDEATRHGVPVVENPPLARALFKMVAIGREVPRDLYRAVAEVLAYVYGLKGRGRER
jgi:flagellar biosynthetic protein FlhB